MKSSNIIQKTYGMRKDILYMCHQLGDNAAHLGGCMSLVELMAVLYDSFVNEDCDMLHDDKRSRIIMSKGHGSIAYYAALHQFGLLIDMDDVKSLLGPNNVYYKQEVRNPEYGIEFSSGSLGQGLAYAIGISFALRQRHNSAQIYVFIGEGECEEGSIWEAASIASHHGLDNITVIIDRNRLQIDGFTEKINSMAPIETRWKAFGFATVVVNGHDVIDIEKAYKTPHVGKPLAIIADTVKGKGISFAENNVEWHQNNLTDSLYSRALDDLEEYYGL